MFGDLSLAATLGDRRQITVGLSQDRYFVEDQIGIKATQRYDINVHDLGDTSDAGPLVALYGNIA
jgi:HK97 family phage major capsid protein